jgi:hypothetical protein
LLSNNQAIVENIGIVSICLMIQQAYTTSMQEYYFKGI